VFGRARPTTPAGGRTRPQVCRDNFSFKEAGRREAIGLRETAEPAAENNSADTDRGATATLDIAPSAAGDGLVGLHAFDAPR
jgi:hypothetical protein